MMIYVLYISYYREPPFLVGSFMSLLLNLSIPSVPTEAAMRSTLEVISDRHMSYQRESPCYPNYVINPELPNCASPPVFLHKPHDDHNLYQRSCCSLWLPIVSNSDSKH